MEEYKRLFSSCLKQLGIRPRSEKEIRDSLSKKSSDTDLINQIVGKLKSENLINDSEFATWYVESRSRSRPRGLRLLQYELSQKGVSADNLQLTTDNEIALAKKALEKKLILWSNLPKLEFKIKAQRFLNSRGFGWSAIEEAVKKAYN